MILFFFFFLNWNFNIFFCASCSSRSRLLRTIYPIICSKKIQILYSISTVYIYMNTTYLFAAPSSFFFYCNSFCFWLEYYMVFICSILLHQSAHRRLVFRLFKADSEIFSQKIFIFHLDLSLTIPTNSFLLEL